MVNNRMLANTTSVKRVNEDEIENFTFSLTWQAKDRTLEEKEIEEIHKNIGIRLISDLGAQIR